MDLDLMSHFNFSDLITVPSRATFQFHFLIFSSGNKGDRGLKGEKGDRGEKMGKICYMLCIKG